MEMTPEVAFQTGLLHGSLLRAGFEVVPQMNDDGYTDLLEITLTLPLEWTHKANYGEAEITQIVTVKVMQP